MKRKPITVSVNGVETALTPVPLPMRFKAYSPRGTLGTAIAQRTIAVGFIQNEGGGSTAEIARTNIELARAFMSLGRHRNAIRIHREVLGGTSVGEGNYATRTEVHDLLARGFEAAGQQDSAAVHYRKVAEAWKKGDVPYRARAADARRKLQAFEQ